MFQPTTIAGRAIRLPLRLIPKSAVLPILSGPNRGLRWIVGAGTHGCWMGRYERQEIDGFIDQLSPSSVVWDIGAHAGYFAMACATRCAKVIACEPSARNLDHLSRHVTMNRLSNIAIVNAAISNRHGEQVSFGGHLSSYQGGIGRGEESVRTATIDGLIRDGFAAPSIIKMDIEGGEVDALRGATDTLANQRPSMLVAVHSAPLAADCTELFEAAGYVVEVLNVATIWAYPSIAPSHSVGYTGARSLREPRHP